MLVIPQLEQPLESCPWEGRNLGKFQEAIFLIRRYGRSIDRVHDSARQCKFLAALTFSSFSKSPEYFSNASRLSAKSLRSPPEPLFSGCPFRRKPALRPRTFSCQWSPLADKRLNRAIDSARGCPPTRLQEAHLFLLAAGRAANKDKSNSTAGEKSRYEIGRSKSADNPGHRTTMYGAKPRLQRGIDALSGGDESLLPLQLAQRDAHHTAKTHSDARCGRPCLVLSVR